jgi:hypothetical protein
MARDVAHQQINRLEDRSVAVMTGRLCFIAKETSEEDVKTLDCNMGLPEEAGTVRDAPCLLSRQC